MLIQLIAVSLASVLLYPAPAAAQETTAVVTAVAPIYLRPDATMTPLRTAAVNTTLKVLEETGDWIRVEFQDPQFGRRVGYVQARNVRVSRAEQVPIDLSIKPAPGASVQRADAPQPEASAPQPSRQTSRGFKRGWIDVNFGLAVAATNPFTITRTSIIAQETATQRVEYHLPMGAAFNFGGGFMFTPTFGVGASFAGTAHKDTADMAISIPHPTIANRLATDTSTTTDDLERIESAVHIQAMFATDISDRVRLRLFGGPTVFRLQQDVVSKIDYFQQWNTFTGANSVDILSYEIDQIAFEDAVGWGGHVGGDVSWFFTRVVGVGGFGAYSHGRISVFDLLSGDEVKLTVGGFQAGGGLRLRF